MIDNYFRVTEADEVVPFASKSLASIESAWIAALAIVERVWTSGAIVRARPTVLVWKRIPVRGPWSHVPIVGESTPHVWH
jgi:hypothetical protein